MSQYIQTWIDTPFGLCISNKKKTIYTYLGFYDKAMKRNS